MELSLAALQQFVSAHIQIFVIVTSGVFFACAAAVFIRVFREFFGLYQRQFYAQVDQGLRDVLVLLEPSQVFMVTIGVALVVCPLMYFLLNPVAALVIGGLVLFAPPQILKIMKKRRADKFVKQMPDALAAMGSALKSGLNLVKTLQQVVKNQPEPLAQEFAQVLVEYRIGTDLNDSFAELAKRIDRPEVILMNSAIKINRAVGGNLASTFESLANTLRETSKVEGKIKALTAMGESQGRLATFFPIGMGFVFFQQEPMAMRMLFVTNLGWIWLAAMGTMALLGTIFIKKIVNVDV
jgi:tight adherence protein B